MVRIICALLLLVGTVNAQTILTTRDTIRYLAASQNNIPPTGTANLDTVKMNAYVNMAYQVVFSDSEMAAIQKADTIEITGSVYGTALDWDTAMFTLSSDFLYAKAVWRVCTTVIVSDDGQNKDRALLTDLMPMPPGNLFAVMGGQKKPQDAIVMDRNDMTRPRYFTTWNKQLVLYPRPIRGDKYIVWYVASGTKLTAGTGTVEVLPKAFDAIVSFAAYRMAVDMGNYMKAAIFKDDYLRAIGARKSTRMTVEEEGK